MNCLNEVVECFANDHTTIKPRSKVEFTKKYGIMNSYLGEEVRGLHMNRSFFAFEFFAIFVYFLSFFINNIDDFKPVPLFVNSTT